MRAWSLIVLMLSCLANAHLAQAQTDSAEPAAVQLPAPLEQLTERGPVRVRVSLEPAEPVIGDLLTLSLEVTAEPGVELIMPEFGQALDRFSIRDFVPRESIDGDGRTRAMQRYGLSAPMSGPQFIPPIAVEFVDRRTGQRPAPEGEDAYEILTQRLDFEVQSVLPEASADELEPALGELEPIASLGAAEGWNWVLAAVLLVVLVVAFGLGHLLFSRVKARRASAYEIASSRLDALKARPRPEEAEAVGAFFVELSDLVRHYLEDRFGLHAPEHTTEEFLDVASGSPDLSEAHQGFLQDFLRRADQVKFARYLPGADYIEDVLLAAERFLEQTRAEAAHDEPSAKPGEAARV